jgi:Uma2 family endonuclease
MARSRKTLADLRALPDATPAELICGEIYVTPSPSEPHQSAVLAVGSLLRTHGRAYGTGRAYVAPLDAYLPSGDVVQPDALFVRCGSTVLAEEGVRSIPDLVIEVLSPSHPLHDRVVKRDLYARNRVRESWIVDPQEQTIEILLLAGEPYRPAGYGRGEAVLASAPLQDLSIPLIDVFA